MHLPRDTDETVDLDGTDTEAPEQEAPWRNRVSQGLKVWLPPAVGHLNPRLEWSAWKPRTPTVLIFRMRTVPACHWGGYPVTGGFRGVPDPGDALGGDSGIQALEDEEMDAIRGESPVSEIEERRIRMANEYLARMKRQIVTAWDQPDTANARHKGEIRFSVDSRGYLRTSRVHLPSGHEPLDESALRAVRAVERYRVPDSRPSCASTIRACDSPIREHL